MDRFWLVVWLFVIMPIQAWIAFEAILKAWDRLCVAARAHHGPACFYLSAASWIVLAL